MKIKITLKKTENSREYKLIKRENDLNCSRCPPHGGENASRSKRGPKKPKKKDKR